jgi:hypothetical protein
MPTRKTAATNKVPAKKAAAKKPVPVAKKTAAKEAPQPVAAATFRTKIDLANLAIGAKTVKQLARAVAKLAQTLAKMDESGAVSLEQPVTAKGAHLATTDAKAAKRFGMEEGRAPRGAKTAAPAAKKTAGTTHASATPAPAKKAAAKNAKKAAAKKTRTRATPADVDPAAETVNVTSPAKKGSAKKAGKKAARKKDATGANEAVRSPGNEPAAALQAPAAGDMPGSEGTAS